MEILNQIVSAISKLLPTAPVQANAKLLSATIWASRMSNAAGFQHHEPIVIDDNDGAENLLDELEDNCLNHLPEDPNGRYGKHFGFYRTQFLACIIEAVDIIRQVNENDQKAAPKTKKVFVEKAPEENMKTETEPEKTEEKPTVPSAEETKVSVEEPAKKETKASSKKNK